MADFVDKLKDLMTPGGTSVEKKGEEVPKPAGSDAASNQTVVIAIPVENGSLKTDGIQYGMTDNLDRSVKAVAQMGLTLDGSVTQSDDKKEKKSMFPSMSMFSKSTNPPPPIDRQFAREYVTPNTGLWASSLKKQLPKFAYIMSDANKEMLEQLVVSGKKLSSINEVYIVKLQKIPKTSGVTTLQMVNNNGSLSETLSVRIEEGFVITNITKGGLITFDSEEMHPTGWKLWYPKDNENTTFIDIKEILGENGKLQDFKLPEFQASGGNPKTQKYTRKYKNKKNKKLNTRKMV